MIATHWLTAEFEGGRHQNRIDKIKAICDKYNLWLVEDSCDALGSEFNINNRFIWMQSK